MKLYTYSNDLHLRRALLHATIDRWARIALSAGSASLRLPVVVDGEEARAV